MANKRSAEEAGIENKGERSKSEKLLQIRKQIEYYFGEFNLPSDRFMKKVIREDIDGWFPAKTLLRFKKMKALEANLSDIVEVCENSEVVKMNMEQTHLKRRYSLKGAKWVMERTIQAKGFPREYCDINDLVEFWSKTCPEVKNIKFCGRNTGIIKLSFEEKELADEWAMNKHEVTYRGEKIVLGRDFWKPDPAPDRKSYRKRERGRKGRNPDGGGGSARSGDKGEYHSRLGKRQKLSDDVVNKDLKGKGSGIEVEVEKQTDIAKEHDNKEKNSEAEKADLSKPTEGMEVEVEKQSDIVPREHDNKERKSEVDKADLSKQAEGMKVGVEKQADIISKVHDNKESKSEAEKTDLAKPSEGMEVEVEKLSDIVTKEHDNKETKEEAEKVDLKPTEGMEIEAEKQTDKLTKKQDNIEKKAEAEKADLKKPIVG